MIKEQENQDGGQRKEGQALPAVRVSMTAAEAPSCRQKGARYGARDWEQ